MPSYRRGQLVAVRDSDDCEWKLRIYAHERGGQHFCLEPEHELSQAMWWAQICPAEFIWPNIFLSCDREIIDSLRKELDKEHQIAEQNVFAVELEQELVQRLRRQNRWLCKELQAIGDRNGSQECPPVPHGDCRIGNCAECWEVASLKAVEGDKDE